MPKSARSSSTKRELTGSSDMTSVPVNNNNTNDDVVEHSSSSSTNRHNHDNHQHHSSSANDLHQAAVESHSSSYGSTSEKPFLEQQQTTTSSSRNNSNHNLSRSHASDDGSSSITALRSWIDYFGFSSEDFVQTAYSKWHTRVYTSISQFVGNWTPCTQRRVVVSNLSKNANKDFDHKSFFPPNVINNRKYSIWSFWWLCLLDQFRFSVFNVYFLALACSQFFEVLRVGMMFTYFAPLAFVVVLSMCKEAYDDIKRWQQDTLINSAEYQRLKPDGTWEKIQAEDICVGTIIRVEARQRIPADLILLHTSESSGSCFVRTDQLDGETDWKPRHPIKTTASMDPKQLANTHIVVEAEAPHRDIYSFEATYVSTNTQQLKSGLLPQKTGVDVNSSLWSGCSVASGSVMGVVVYTGIDTRSTLNAERSTTKITLMDRELNFISTWCFVILFVLSILIVVEQLDITSLPISKTFVNLFRFQILMSAIIPISLRVNLDIARLWYSLGMVRDTKKLPGIAVRNTNIPEELGRLHYLFSDKTGTLTCNIMEFRTLHLDDNFALEDTEVNDIKSALLLYFSQQQQQQQQAGSSAAGGEGNPNYSTSSSLSPSSSPQSTTNTTTSDKKVKLSLTEKQKQHQQQQHGDDEEPAPITSEGTIQTNSAEGTPVASFQSLDDDEHQHQHSSSATAAAAASSVPRSHHATASPQQHHHHSHNIVGYNRKQSLLIGRSILSLALCHQVSPVQDEESGEVSFQAASPDEIAMVRFAQDCGVRLSARDTFRKHDDEIGATIEGEIILKVNLTQLEKQEQRSREESNLYATTTSNISASASQQNNEKKTGSSPLRVGDEIKDNTDDDVITLEYDVLRAFPFSSERKCMSIILRNRRTGQISFYMKGADSKMMECTVKNDSTSWLEDRCMELARTGRRTLVFAMRDLTLQEYKQFSTNFDRASASPTNRAQAVEKCMTSIERNLLLVGVTGVEDLLQENVVKTLEHLGVCGIKVWMLTGDKVETAKCIGRSTRLIRTDLVEMLVAKTEQEADELIDQLCAVYARNVQRQVHEEQQALLSEQADSSPLKRLSVKMSLLGGNTNSSPVDNHNNDNNQGESGGFGTANSAASGGEDPMMKVSWALVTDGATLQFCLPGADHPRQKKFLGLASKAESVVVARCSPTQKAAIVKAMKEYCGPEIRTAAIGDGGNDVSMIRAADVGIGLEGLEGKQASLAADYSIPKLCECEWLITWHGRSSYLRTSNLAQFIIHRGVVYAIVQAVFSVMFNGSTMSVFNGYLLTAYATIYSGLPVFALVLNEDVLEQDVEDYPELYRWLLKSRAFNVRSFLQWLWLAFFQGGVMMWLTIKLFSDELFQIVSISFTALLLTELFFVATCVNFKILWQQRRFHFFLFFFAELLSIGVYFLSVFILPDTFDVRFFFSEAMWKNVAIITAASILPVAVIRFLESQMRKWMQNRSRMSYQSNYASMF